MILLGNIDIKFIINRLVFFSRLGLIVLLSYEENHEPSLYNIHFYK